MKNILIIGAGKGIGLKSAELLATNNNLFTISRNETSELNSISSKKYFLDAVADNLDVLGHLPETLHGLVYCPGSITLKPFNRLSPDDFLKDFNQNVLGAVRVLQFCLSRLKNANGASVVLFSTVAVQVGMSFHSSIAVAKAGVEGLCKSLAAELAPQNIRVNAIAPSLTNTSLATALLNTPEKAEAAAKRHPLQRIGTAHDIAAMAAFLLSDNASWITGQVLHVDGGMGVLK